MKKALLLAMFFSFALGGVAFAQEAATCEQYCTELRADPDTGAAPPKGTACICNPLQTDKFTDVFDNVLTLLFNFALVLAPVMVVVAGIMFVTAGGSPERISTAKRILIWTVVGLIIIIASRGLTLVLRGIIGF